MISRAPYLFLLLILIPDIYFDLHYWRNKYPQQKRLMRWLPTIIMVAYTLYLTYEPNFIPEPPYIVYIYLLLLGLIAIPKMVYMLCSVLGLACCRIFHRNKSAHKSRNWGNLIGWILTLSIWYIVFYGSFVGFNKLEVRRHTYSSKSLPQAFDGYRIAIFSDAHVGSYTGSRQKILKRAIDSINSLHPDIIVFTGDLQNTHPQEIYEHLDILASLKAKDGVYSVLGNHDYAGYLDVSNSQKVANERETVSIERQAGWTVLLNSHRIIERSNSGNGKSYLVVAGMENDGIGSRAPKKGNIKKTLSGIKTSDNTFILMLEHDPSAWKRIIIPDGRADLTLSGHTHNMQFTIFGWNPLPLINNEVYDWYHSGEQSLFVTAGIGGLIPFRFGATGEIALITLRKG